MNYNQSIAYLESLPRPDSWHLDKTRKLFELTNTPTNALKIIHVAGTNGKGSVTTLIASILTQAGYKVGVDTSPHLVTHRERITVNNELITEQEFLELFNEVKPIIEQMSEKPSFFEVMTVFAVKHFMNKKVDYAVIEVGLGGRLDSTNILETILSIITTISLDHTRMLGDSIEKIALEKAGIIKNSPVITAATGSAFEVIKKTSTQKNTELIQVLSPENIILSSEKTSFSFKGKNYDCSLLGKHQALNACIALTAINELKLPISDEAIKKGLMQAKWRGRLEVISKNPLMVVDGAHNPAGAEALQQNINDIWPNKNICLVFAVMKDKDYSSMITQLKKINLKQVILTKASIDRSEEPEKLASFFEKPSITHSIKEAISLAKLSSCDLVLVTGSLYALGDFFAENNDS